MPRKQTAVARHPALSDMERSPDAPADVGSPPQSCPTPAKYAQNRYTALVGQMPPAAGEPCAKGQESTNWRDGAKIRLKILVASLMFQILLWRLDIRRKADTAAIHVNIVVSTARSISIAMMQNQHRARAHIDAISKRYKWLFDALQKIREGERNWPDYIYVPMPVFAARISEIVNPGVLTSIANSVDNDERVLSTILFSGLTFAIWRITQGVYRFDETLYPHLLNTQGAGKIPADILCRLPEWCVYLETPGLMLPEIGGAKVPMQGAWARIDVDRQGKVVLAITPDADYDDDDDVITAGQHPPFKVPTISATQTMLLLPNMTVKDGISATFEHLLPSDFHPGPNVSLDEIICNASEWIKPVVNLLLYLCAGADYAGPAPQNPQPKKTKRGLRLFPSNKPTVWDVGVRMGSALRAAYAAQSASDGGAGSGRQVRPHIRRAHWHGFRSGARLTPEGQPIPAEKRRFDLRWLPPIAVNIEGMGNDNIPSVIRLVK